MTFNFETLYGGVYIILQKVCERGFYHVMAYASSHFFVFYLRNPDHVRKTNFTTSKTQILLHFRVTFLFFLFETLMT